MPPVASGSTTGAIAVPSSHTRSTTGGNTGVVSGTTSIVNVSVSVSPSKSVTLYVYVLAICGLVGVPDSVRVEALNVTPRGGDGDNE